MSSQALLDLQQKYPNCEMLQKLKDNFHIFWEIFEACGKKWELGCGSYLMDGQTYDYCPKMYQKQKLLYDKAKIATRALEVGVYMGHSLFIMLLANPELPVTLIDIDDTFSWPAINVLSVNFPKATFTFCKGDSHVMIPQIKDYFDLFHIDGKHVEGHTEKDWSFCIPRFMAKDLTIVYDDYDECKDFVVRSLGTMTPYHIPSRFSYTVSWWRNACVEYQYSQKENTL
jgi:hypothetical protein